jgi:diaminopimelate epimerase
MQVKFTKMQGAGNDFVVLDETRGLLGLSAAQYRFLGNRHFGVGADQILSVRPAASADVDFSYVIHNADGGEVEHCGNGARCFVRYVRERGLTDKTTIRVKTVNNTLALTMQPDGLVAVDMGLPVFDHGRIPFQADALQLQKTRFWENYEDVSVKWSYTATNNVVNEQAAQFAVLSMGNPHAVLVVNDVDSVPVEGWGQAVQQLANFPRGVNVGFMQILSRSAIKLRVYERGAGETLACGTGTCAAVVAGIRHGLLDAQVQVRAKGGILGITWAGMGQHVHMTGPATTVFDGTIEIPDNLS